MSIAWEILACLMLATQRCHVLNDADDSEFVHTSPGNINLCVSFATTGWTSEFGETEKAASDNGLYTNTEIDGCITSHR